MSGAGSDYADRLSFWCCCGSDDPGYGAEEYVARGQRGGLLCFRLRRRTGEIVFARTGYHDARPEIPPCG